MLTLEYFKQKENYFFNENGNISYSFRNSTKSKIESRLWGNWPKESEYLNINSLAFNVTSGDAEKINEWPDFLNKLSNLKFLGLPIDMFEKRAGEISSKIQSLRLFQPVVNNSINYKWPERCFPYLIYLSIPELIREYYIFTEHMPNLRWLEYDLSSDKKGDILKKISDFKSLKHLILSHAKNLDIFSPFENLSITTLELFACIGKQFPIQNIIKLNKLRFLSINNIAVEFNCEWLLHLPHLEELDLLNLRKIKNANALLKLKNLNGLSIFNCAVIFKEISKQSLIDKKLSFLQIDSQNY